MSALPIYIPGSAGAHFGHVVRTRRAGRFQFRESRYRAGLRMPAHYHPRAYFNLVIEGGVREWGAHGEHDHRAGSVHFHAAGEPHSDRMGHDGARCLSIILNDELSGRLAPVRSDSAVSPWGSPAARIARRCHLESLAIDSASDLSLEALTLELIGTMLRGKGPRDRKPPRWLLAVRDHLHDRFLERVRLADLSAVAGIHEVHLVRAFRRHFGATPGAYQRELRIEHARRRLVDTERPIVELALEAGFSSQAHFTRVFHRLMGTTPAAYRRERSPRFE